MLARLKRWLGIEKPTQPWPPPRTIVVAKTYKAFTDWCRENERHPQERDLMFITTDSVNHGERLLGIQLTKDDKIIKYDHYYEGRYTLEVLDLLSILEARRIDG